MLVHRGAYAPNAHVAATVRVPGFNLGDDEGARLRAELKTMLVATSGIGVAANNILFDGGVSRDGTQQVAGINHIRRANGRVLVSTVTAEDFAKYADIALTDAVLNTVVVNLERLPRKWNRPLLFVPDVPVLSDDAQFTHEEVLAFYEIAAKYIGVEFDEWDGNLDFLRQWSVGELLNAREGAPGDVAGLVVPTTKHLPHHSSHKSFLEQLRNLQSKYDGVIDARLFHGALLANTDVNVPIDLDVNCVDPIGLDPKRESPDSVSDDLFTPHTLGYHPLSIDKQKILAESHFMFPNRLAVRAEPLSLGL